MNLDPSNVFLGLSAIDRDDLLSQMGDHLFRGGFVKESFTPALILREERFPTGLPGREFGVAMPHVDPEHVLVPGYAVATLKKPVAFRIMGTDDGEVEASIVFMLMLHSFDDQISFLKRVMSVIQNHDLLSELLACQESEELYTKIKAAL